VENSKHLTNLEGQARAPTASRGGGKLEGVTEGAIGNALQNDGGEEETAEGEKNVYRRVG